MNGKLSFSILALLIIAMLAWPSAVNARPAPQLNQNTHIVKAGETLSQIAARYGVSQQAIQDANNLANANRIFAGMVLVIPAPGSVAANPPQSVAGTIPGTSARSSQSTATCASPYIVQAGDSLSGIAARCEISLSSLASANGLSSWSRIFVGQRLTIPGLGEASAVLWGSSSSTLLPSRTGDGCPNPYIVRSGDTLSAIAGRCGASVADLMRWNNLFTTTIRVGQSLITRGDWAASPAPQAPSPASTPAPPQTGPVPRAPVVIVPPSPTPQSTPVPPQINIPLLPALQSTPGPLRVDIPPSPTPRIEPTIPP